MKKNLTIGLLLLFSVTVLFSFAFAKSDKDAWLGITTQTVDDELADAFDLEVTYGAIINEIISDSPAEQAGLSEGDIIIAYNSDKVYDYDDLLDYLEDSAPDEKVSLTIMRENDKMNIDVTLEVAPKKMKRRFYNKKGLHLDDFSGIHDIQHIPNIPNIPDIPDMPYFNFNSIDGNSIKHLISYDNSSYIGVNLTSLSDQLREYFGLREDEGVLVSEVEDDSPAEKAGIKAGDIIIKADSDDISDFGDLKDVINDKDEGEIVSLTIVRDKNKKQIDVAVAEREDKDSYIFKVPDMSFNFPKGQNKNMFFTDNLHEFFDSDEFNEEMKELKKELENLKFDLNNEMFEKFNSEEFKQEMKKFKKELKENESLIDKELKNELKEMKKELQKLEKRIDD